MSQGTVLVQGELLVPLLDQCLGLVQKQEVLLGYLMVLLRDGQLLVHRSLGLLLLLEVVDDLLLALHQRKWALWLDRWRSTEAVQLPHAVDLSAKVDFFHGDACFFRWTSIHRWQWALKPSSNSPLGSLVRHLGPLLLLVVLPNLLDSEVVLVAQAVFDALDVLCQRWLLCAHGAPSRAVDVDHPA